MSDYLGLLDTSSNHDDIFYLGAFLDIKAIEFGFVLEEWCAIEKELDMVALHPIGEAETVADGVLEQSDGRLAHVVDIINLASWPGHRLKCYPLVIASILLIRIHTLNLHRRSINSP